MPRQDSPQAAADLAQVCEHLLVEHAVTDVISIHPESWTEKLVAAGADRLQRMIHLSLRLEANLLGMHQRPLPDGYRIEPLLLPEDDPGPLSVLSHEDRRTEDLRVWEDALSGCYGPVIPEGSRMAVSLDGLHAAVVVTSHRGSPFVANIATAPGERGRGFGHAVLVDAMAGLAAAGHTDCELSVVEDNWVAHRMYRSIGFHAHRPVSQVSWFRRSTDA